jgi:uncharacterized protein YcnI
MFFKLYNLILINIESNSINPLSDITFYPNNLPYTSSSTRLALKITHACFENSTNRIETIFPDNFVIKPEFKQGWTTNINTHETSTSFFSNITWHSDDISNNIPNEFNELFWFWIKFPSTYQVDTKYYAPTIQYCYPSGQNKWTSTSISGPISTPESLAPYFTISSTFGSNNDNNNNFSRLDILIISTTIISIISLLMNFLNEYRNFTNKNYQTHSQKQIINVSEKEVEIKVIKEAETTLNNV